MSGSLGHVIKDGNYLGDALLDNMGDAMGAIDEMAFVLLTLTTPEDRERAVEEFYRCSREEQPWPTWMGEYGNGVPLPPETESD